MTKTKIDYSKGLIYKIVCNDLECKDIYIGSTTDFIRRKYQHKSTCNNENSKNYNLKVYKSIRANGGWGNWSMIELQKYPCKDGNELRAQERLYYEELNGNLNIRNPNRSQKENYEQHQEYYKKYYEHNKEQLKEQHKDYYKNNKEIINEQRKQKIECICGSTIVKHTKLRHERSTKHLNYVNENLNGSI